MTTKSTIASLFKKILTAMGEDINRAGLKDTPDRVSRMYGELTAGYGVNPKDVLARRFPIESYDQMVILRGINFTSLCEHHVLPFMGTAHVAYLPGKELVGLSKLARLVECFSMRLQIQERMTAQIADALMEYLKPQGCGVIVMAHHECMSCRGVKQANATMVTSALRGIFLNTPSVREEFLSLIRLSDRA